MRRTEKYAAVTKDEAERSRWTFYEAVNFRVVKDSFQRAKGGLGNKPSKPDPPCNR